LKCGFTIQHFKECIELAKDKDYVIVPPVGLVEQKKVIVLRHDIDWSVENAYELANIEYDLGVSAAYYVYMHSATYSALAPKSMSMIKQMYGMGHEIGLHYDSRYSMSFEMDILSRIHNKAIYSCSQHYPGETKPESYQGIIDCRDLELKYISDSGMNWREGCMCQWIGKKDKLQILVHPEWWVTNSTNRVDGINKLFVGIQDSMAREMQQIKQDLVTYCKDLGISY